MTLTAPDRLRLTPVTFALIVVILLLLGLGTVVLRQAEGDDAPAAGAGQTSPTPLAAPSPVLPTAEPSSVPIPQPTDLADSAGAVLPAGTCLTETSQSTTVASVTPISCDQEHTGEVFISVVLTQPDGTPYPGQDALEEDSRFLCQGPAFESYVGLPYAGEPSSRFFVYPLVPTETSWAEGDRDISCVLYDVAAPMVGSQRGSNR
ncbi:MAG: septum formation family protein [Euzebya sp.]